MDQELDPRVAKLLAYAKDKQIVSWDELADHLGQDFINSPEMEVVLQLLTQQNIQVIEEDDLDDEVDETDDDVDDLADDEEVEVADEAEKDDRSQLLNTDKGTNVDDPIRLYLHEIGKEKLLTGDQEVSLSKEMEEGENIIKDVIKQSGMMIPEFFAVAQKAFARIDMHEPG
ncbi:MAG: RNA polymerase sigma factor RpoD, partial [Treponemataceae bacterium]|nr:RNA polymerase sigma factor RpoD [Treponemataceae bacterium]